MATMGTKRENIRTMATMGTYATHLKPDNLGVGEGKAEAPVAGAVLHLVQTSILPCHSSHGLGNQASEDGQHGPTTVDNLTLTESLQTENLGVWLQAVSADFIRGADELANHVAGLLLAQVLVKLVQLKLQVLSWLGEAKRIETTVTRQGAIQPVRGSGSGVPQTLSLGGRRGWCGSL